MRLLILTHFFPPEMGAAAARMHSLALWLGRFGHTVTVVTGFPNYPSGIVPEGYRGKLRLRERPEGMDVLRTWVYASPRSTTVHRLLNYFSFVASATVSAWAARDGYDVVLTSSPPLFVGLAGLASARLRRIPLVFDIRDIWPEVAVEAGEFAPNGTFTRMGRQLAGFIYRHADHITCVTENKRKKLLAAEVPDSKLTVVANGVELDHAALPHPNEVRDAFGLGGKFVVLYAGLIGIAQGVDIAVEAASHLRSEADVHFLIVGDGVRRDALAKRVRELELHNVTLIPRQPREKIPGLIAAADVCLVPLVSSNLDDAVPTKLLEAWAYERPVILAAAGEAALLVHQCEGGLVVPPEEPARLAQAVLTLKMDRKRLSQFARNGAEFVRQRFDRQALARQMERVLQVAIRRERSQAPGQPNS